jgi:hypothetical protein
MKSRSKMMLRPLILILCASLLLGNELAAQTDTLRVSRHVLAAGGGSSSTTDYGFKGTLGQSAAGRSLAGSFQFYSGFWTGTPFGCCISITGDLNSDGSDNTILDLNFMVNRIFRGGPDPLCSPEGDLDGNGTPLQILDLNFMVNKIFRGGPNPAPCP